MMPLALLMDMTLVRFVADPRMFAALCVLEGIIAFPESAYCEERGRTGLRASERQSCLVR